MTIQGHDSPLPVTVEDTSLTTPCRGDVARAQLSAASDLLFIVYATLEQAFENAAIVMRALRAMVKIEGAPGWRIDTRREMLTERAAGLWSSGTNATVGEYLRRL